MASPTADYGRVIWEPELGGWITIQVTERVMRSWGENHDLAVKYAEACGLTVVNEPHRCTMSCDHPPLSPIDSEVTQ